MSFLIVDLEWGGLDGWYSNREDAERIAEHIKEKLGHDRVVVVERKQDGKPIRIGWAFLSDRERKIDMDPVGILSVVKEMEGRPSSEISAEVLVRLAKQVELRFTQ
jgi:hypothetical protein